MSHDQGPAPDKEIQDYLDGLLREATEPAPPRHPRETPLSVKRQPVVKRRAKTAEVIRPFAEPKQVPSIPVQEPVVEVVEPAPEPAVVESVEERVEDGAQSLLPPEGPFECLLFTVGGIKLAAPLVALGSIYPMEDLTPLFGQADWFMGMRQIQDRKLRAVDTAQLVMPERYQPEMTEKYEYLITIHGADWALAVDNIECSMTLSPEEVRWRQNKSARPWLAGTVVEHMCAVLDLEAMERLFG